MLASRLVFQLMGLAVCSVTSMARDISCCRSCQMMVIYEIVVFGRA